MLHFFSLTEPDYNYLNFKAKINNLNKLKDSLNKRLKNEKLEKIAKDVESFLINLKEVNRILNFKEFFNQL